MKIREIGKIKGMGLNELYGAGMVFVVLAIGLGIGAIVLSTFRANTTVVANNNATSIIDASLQGLVTLGSWQNIIALVIAAAVILGIIGGAFMGRSNVGGGTA